eukprot:g8362.t1
MGHHLEERGNSHSPTDVGDAWYTGGEDEWAPAGDGGDQYSYAEEDTYGYPSAPRPPPPLPRTGWGTGARDWDRYAGVPAGGRINSSKSKARQRRKGRERSDGGGGGGVEKRAGDDGFDEVRGWSWGGDLVQEYMRSFKGRVVLSGGSSVAGAALGAAISKPPTLGRVPLPAVRTVGLVRLPRRPFPPAENPWKYKRAGAVAELEEAGVADDGNLPAEFSMAKSLLSVAFLGGFAGYLVSQFPFVFLPTFMLALGGGVFLAYVATTRKRSYPSPRHEDVAFLGLISEINSDVALLFTKAQMIKDRVVVMLASLYAVVAKLVGRVQREAGDADDDNGDDDYGESDAGGSVLSEDGGRQLHRSRRRHRPPDEPPMSTSSPPPPSGYADDGSYQGGGW